MQGEGVWEMHAWVNVPAVVEKGELRTASGASFTDLTLKPGTSLFVGAPLSVGRLDVREGNVRLTTFPVPDDFIRYEELAAGAENCGFVPECPGGKVINNAQARTLRLICPAKEEE